MRAIPAAQPAHRVLLAPPCRQVRRVVREQAMVRDKEAAVRANGVAEALGVTERTVQRDWKRARALLHADLYPDGSADPDA